MVDILAIWFLVKVAGEKSDSVPDRPLFTTKVMDENNPKIDDKIWKWPTTGLEVFLSLNFSQNYFGLFLISYILLWFSFHYFCKKIIFFILTSSNLSLYLFITCIWFDFVRFYFVQFYFKFYIRSGWSIFDYYRLDNLISVAINRDLDYTNRLKMVLTISLDRFRMVYLYKIEFRKIEWISTVHVLFRLVSTALCSNLQDHVQFGWFQGQENSPRKQFAPDWAANCSPEFVWLTL